MKKISRFAFTAFALIATIFSLLIPSSASAQGLVGQPPPRYNQNGELVNQYGELVNPDGSKKVVLPPSLENKEESPELAPPELKPMKEPDKQLRRPFQEEWDILPVLKWVIIICSVGCVVALLGILVSLLYPRAARAYRRSRFEPGFARATARAILDELGSIEFDELVLDVDNVPDGTMHFHTHTENALRYHDFGPMTDAVVILLRAYCPAESIREGRRYRISAKQLRSFVQ